MSPSCRPPTLSKLILFADGVAADSAAVLAIIYHDEIGHVATGMRWFLWVAEQRGLAPKAAYQEMVKRYFKSPLKPPFNTDAREAANFPADWYEPLGR